MPLRFPSASRWLSQTTWSPSQIPTVKMNPQQRTISIPLRQATSPISIVHTPHIQNRLFSSRMTPKGVAKSTWRTTRFTERLHHQNLFRRFFNSSRPKNSSHSGQSGSLSQRLKTLSKEYGWSALWVYLLLSALDFPVCFAAVRLFGVENIGHYEHMIVESAKDAINRVWSRGNHKSSAEQNKEGSSDQNKEGDGDVAYEQNANGEGASLWTQLALAYAIHKSLIFIRVPLTAAITPKVVKTLRLWGWDIVKGKPKGM